MLFKFKYKYDCDFIDIEDNHVWKWKIDVQT